MIRVTVPLCFVILKYLFVALETKVQVLFSFVFLALVQPQAPTGPWSVPLSKYTEHWLKIDSPQVGSEPALQLQTGCGIPGPAGLSLDHALRATPAPDVVMECHLCRTPQKENPGCTENPVGTSLHGPELGLSGLLLAEGCVPYLLADEYL